MSEHTLNSYRELVKVLDAAEELIRERQNPAPDYNFRAVLHRRLEEATGKARAAITPEPDNG